MRYVPAELRRLVIESANHCCEYCLLSQQGRLLSFEIDHIVTQRHRGQTVLENLCLSCPQCNRLKGSDISSIDPNTNLVTPLFNPRQQVWTTHFAIESARITPLTAEGRVTVFLLRLNSPRQIETRRLLLLLGEYLCQTG